MANGDVVTKGRKFSAYIIAQILTSGFVFLMAFLMLSEDLVTLAQFYIGFETVLTAGYIGFNVLQKKQANGQPKN